MNKVSFVDDINSEWNLFELMKTYIKEFHQPPNRQEVDIMADFRHKILVGNRHKFGNVNVHADNHVLLEKIGEFGEAVKDFHKLKNELRDYIDDIDEKMLF